MMEEYQARSPPPFTSDIRDVTSEAQELLDQMSRFSEPYDLEFPEPRNRYIDVTSICTQESRPKPRSLYSIELSKHHPQLDLSALAQLVDISQTRLIAKTISHLNGIRTQDNLKDVVNKAIEQWEWNILTGDGGDEGWYAGIRPIDLGMTINRIRGLRLAA
jgi:MRB1590 C-terminal domain